MLNLEQTVSKERKMIITKTVKFIKRNGFFALLPLALLFMNFSNNPEIQLQEYTIEIGDPIDANAVEKELAPYLQRLASDKTDSQALTFLNRTFVHLSYKYPDQKKELAVVITDLVKKYEAPVIAEFSEGANTLTAKLAVE